MPKSKKKRILQGIPLGYVHTRAQTFRSKKAYVRKPKHINKEN